MPPHEIRRLLRRRALTVVHPGVYIDHTGPLTDEQRAWAAVAYAGKAALWGPSALPSPGRPAPRSKRPDSEGPPPIHVAVHHHCQVRSIPGVVVHRVVQLHAQVRWNLGPPRQRVEDALLDTVRLRRLSESDRIGLVADLVGSGATTAIRMRTALGRRSRVADRRWWEEILADLVDGTSSVLEHGYLTRVERPHRLPTGRRQVRGEATLGTVYRDVEYDGLLVVELDGRLFHNTARNRDRDFDRDLDAAVDGRTTIRLTYGQVFDRPCLTAKRIGVLLRRAGIGSGARPCGPGCPVNPAA